MFGFTDDMFSDTQRIKFHGFKNGEHRFRILPPFAKGQLYAQVDLHWGFTDENGAKKSLKCTKWTHKTCAICDEVDRIKGEIEMIKNNPSQFPTIEESNMAIEEREKRVSDIKRKPTYLWNILTEDNLPKVLQLSWNGHEPLLNKVKFLWEQSRVNVTDPENSMQMWCSRTGQNAKTRYQYELIANSGRKLENIQTLIDLTKVYKDTTPAELKGIVERGYVLNTSEDPNDRDFTAAPPTTTQTQQPTNTQQQAAPQGNVAQPGTQQQSAPATTQASGSQLHSNTGMNAQTNVSPSSQMPAGLPNVDDDIAAMQNILNS